MAIEQRHADNPSLSATLTDARRALPTPSPRWRMRLFIAFGAAVYYLLWAITAFDKVNPTDLDIFFIPATRIALAGRPLEVYTLRIGLEYPNANGPLSLLPLTFAAWLAQAHGWLGDPIMRRMLVFAICAPFPLLVGWEALRAMERFGPPLRGMLRALVYLPVILSPLLWLDALYYGHIEQAIVVWLALAATRMLADARYLRGGALLGLALLTRSDAVRIALGVGLTLLAWRRWRGALLTAVAASGTVLLGLTPFLLADAHDVIFSLVTFRAALPVGGGDLWSLSSAPLALAAAQRFDALFTVLVAALLVLVAHVTRPDLDFDTPDIYGLLALASFCFAMLIKTLWPYYFLESALLATVWVLAAAPRRTVTRPTISAGAWRAWGLLWLAPLAITFCALMSEYGLEAVNYSGWQAPWSQVNIVCELITLAIGVTALLGGPRLRASVARDTSPESAPVTATGGILPESASEVALDG